MPFHIYKTVNDRFYPHPRVVNFWINATFPVTLKLYEITGFILLQTAWLSKNPITQNIGYYFYTIYLQKVFSLIVMLSSQKIQRQIGIVDGKRLVIASVKSESLDLTSTYSPLIFLSQNQWVTFLKGSSAIIS